ncbi:hypothetical protein RSAG8_09538, partial [Rhizoctonia solani AG-8 WAC10335]
MSGVESVPATLTLDLAHHRLVKLEVRDHGHNHTFVTEHQGDGVSIPAMLLHHPGGQYEGTHPFHLRAFGEHLSLEIGGPEDARVVGMGMRVPPIFEVGSGRWI